MSPKGPAAFDRLVGLSKPPSKDELGGCNDPQAPWYSKDPAEFVRTWCSACKNTECVRSKGAMMPWVQRMQTQPDYLINDPIFSDLLSHAHRVLAEQEFSPLNAKAERLEIAEQQQDWTIPSPGTPLIPQGKVLQKEDPHEFDDPVEEPEPEIPEPPVVSIPEPIQNPVEAPKPAPKPRVNKPSNTHMPKGGLIIGPAPSPAPDPWTPTNLGTMVLPGAKVVLK